MPTIIQSALHPAGPQAAQLATLWWVMFWTCTVVYVVVLGFLIMALRRGRSRDLERPAARQLTRWVAAAAGVTLVILVGLLTVSVTTGRAIASLSAPDALTIQVTGNQWWWSVEYSHPEPSLRFTTANELHLPVGRPVRILLKSSDVIHSFWVPNLHGKIDLIPGRQNQVWLQVDRPGVYRGQCAEYCGLQHAHMAFSVVAEPSDDFERWATAQRQPAPEPSNALEQKGREVVESGPCAMCHTVRGTLAGGRFGPELTHFASRSTIAAGTAPNTPGYLAGWIADPQRMKPGARMPATGLSADELQAVLAYLSTLK
ncbi:MAG TPA: cytochrome c oxidase subunit II [Vicinamibacterales bacterium]|nr:cytochrome c oxidase subunit II [Vicinamibacterales bacterium]